MKVAFLARSLHVGGAEIQLVTLAAALRHTHETAIVTFYPGGPLEERVRAAGVPLHCIGKRHRWDLPGFAWRLRHVLRALRPDILQTFLGPPNVAGIFLRPPGARLAWGVRASDMDFGHYDWSHRQVFQLERRLSRFADRIVCNSYAGQDFVRAAGFASERMDVIPNGIDTVRFAPDPPAGADLRRELRLDGPVVGLVARLDPMKDHPTFLRAAQILAAQRPDVRFVCVGSGAQPYEQAMRAQARELGLEDRVVWAGPRTDMQRVYNAFDVATLSSAFGEGFPNVLGEAMACGVPCVATDVGDSARVIAALGTVVPRRDAAALAAAWGSLLAKRADERRALGRAARQWIEDNFGVEAMVARTERLYRDMMAAA